MAWWLLEWLVGQPIDVSRSLVGLAISGCPSLAAAIVVARRRLEEGVGPNPTPPRRSIYETLADARQRHARAAMFVMLGVVTLLVFDRTNHGQGSMAGLVVGLFGALGIVHMVESNRWERIERERRVRLYELIAPRVLWGSLAPGTVYSVPEADPPDDDGERTLIPLPRTDAGRAPRRSRRR